MDDKQLRITIAQTDIVWEKPAENLEKIRQLLSQCAQSDVFVLPEMFTTGFSVEGKGTGEGMDGTTLRLLKALADRYDTAICGSLIIEEKGCRYNRFVWINPDGSVIHSDKRHLFTMGGEHLHFSQGKSRVIIHYKGWRIAPFICYDLRFPVWSRNRGDYDLMVYVANWPSSRQAVWNTLLPARAIENQACVVGVNRVGYDGNSLHYAGGSVLFSPKGEQITRLDDKEQAVTCCLSLKQLEQFRIKFPLQQDADPFYF